MSQRTQRTSNTPKRIAALTAVIVLAALYVLTLVSAVLQAPHWQRLFLIAVPILAWIFIWTYGKISGKRTLASFDPEPPQGREAPNKADGAESAGNQQSTGNQQNSRAPQNAGNQQNTGKHRKAGN